MLIFLSASFVLSVVCFSRRGRRGHQRFYFGQSSSAARVHVRGNLRQFDRCAQLFELSVWSTWRPISTLLRFASLGCGLSCLPLIVRCALCG